MEFSKTPLEALREYASAQLGLGSAEVPDGVYSVGQLQLVDQTIDGRPTKWVNVPLTSKSGVVIVAASKFASRGFDIVPVKSSKGRWYYRSVPTRTTLAKGRLADLLSLIEGTEITVVGSYGKTPDFPLGSWATQKEAKEAAKSWNTRKFYGIGAVKDGANIISSALLEEKPVKPEETPKPEEPAQ